MNFELFDKLRAHIAGLKPERFNYSWDNDDSCGCVASHCRALTGNVIDEWGGSDVFKRELGVTHEEANYIYGGEGYGEVDSLAVNFEWTGAEKGAGGIREALRRLDLVASRYTRPTISTDLETTKAADREREFLVRCMAVAAEPVEAE